MSDDPADELGRAMAAMAVLAKNADTLRTLQQLFGGSAAPAAPLPPRTAVTVRELWRRYWRAEGHALDSAGTEEGRMRVLLEIRVPDARDDLVKFGDIDIHEVTLETAMAVLDRYATMTTKYGTPPKPGTRNRCRTRLKRLFAWECSRPRAVRMLDENPLRGMPMEKENNIKRSKIAKEETLEALLTHASPIAKAFILICIDTGLRLNEACNLQWTYIDEQTGRVSILGLDRKNDSPLAPKLSARALEAARAIRVKGVSFVFANPKTRTRYHTRWITEHFYEAVDLAGLQGVGGERITPHTLRHSFVYKARVKWKLGQRTVREMIGQKTDSAFNRYGIVDQDEMDAAYEARDIAIQRDLGAIRSGPHGAPTSGDAAVGQSRLVGTAKKSNT